MAQERTSPSASGAWWRALLAAALLAAMISYGYFASRLFLKYPPVWPDEPLFYEPARSLLTDGKLSLKAHWPAVEGIDSHVYIMPPAYFLYLAPWLALRGGDILTLRLSSVALGAMGVLVAFGLCRRVGAGGARAAIGPIILLADTVYLRGSLIARPDMLCLVLGLLALWLWTSPRAGSWRHLLLVGAVSALAPLTHPMGIAFPAAIAAAGLASPPTRRSTTLAALAVGMAIPLCAYGLYAFQDVSAFKAQFGGALARKLGPGEEGGTPRTLQHSLALAVGQYSQGYFRYLLAAGWAAGVAGLVAAAWRNRRLIALPVAQVLLAAGVVRSQEMWYPLYLVPLTAVGLVAIVWRQGNSRTTGRMPVERMGETPMLRGNATPMLRGNAVSLLTAALVAVLVAGNVKQSIRHDTLLNRTGAAATNYWSWCQALSRHLPVGSRVLLCSIPDPYFGLLKRGDLDLREFVGEGFALDAARYHRHLSQCDYMILGSYIDGKLLRQFVRDNCELVALVGTQLEGGYRAGVYRVKKPPEQLPASGATQTH
jgi:hypothetical protein